MRRLIDDQCETEVILNETDLVRGLRERNPAAVRHLSECWVPSVWRFVYVRVNGDQHLAEDIVSEAVLALISAAGDPDKEINNPGGWLRSVASNKVNDHFRAAARVQHLLDQAPNASGEDSEDNPVEKQELKERRVAIREVLESMNDASRLALEWKYVDRLSVREIADRLDLTEKAAESVLFRARREFRTRLERDTDEVSADMVREVRSNADRASSPSAASTGRGADDEEVERPRGQRRPTANSKRVDSDSDTDPEADEHPAGAEHPIPVSNGE